MRRSRVAVIGGGIGGLTAAGLLAREGHEVTLFEQGSTLGGKAQSVTVNGITLDTGPTLLTLPALVRGTFVRVAVGRKLARSEDRPSSSQPAPKGLRASAFQAPALFVAAIATPRFLKIVSTCWQTPEGNWPSLDPPRPPLR